MTAPDMLLAGARTVLDQLEHQARAATPGPWKATSEGGSYSTDLGDEYWATAVVVRADAESAVVAQFGEVEESQADAAHIAAWSPSFVLAVVGMLRATVDGWADLLDLHSPHYEDRPPDRVACFECESPYPCASYRTALAGLERLASLDMTGAADG